MSYAVIALGGKQYRVREGQRLLVDRLAVEEGETLTPTVLLLGGEGDTQLAPAEAVVTARVVGHVLGEKIRIGKYKPKKGYRRHAGFRAKLSQIEIAEIGTGGEAERRPARERAKAPAQATEEATRPEALPPGYEEMTVAQISQAVGDWKLDAVKAALAYEQEHAARKTALAALESAIAAKEGD